MSWDSDLIQLSRRPPSENAKTAVLDAMRGTMHDRASALVMAAFADTALQGALAYALGLTQPGQFDEKFYKIGGEFTNFYKRTKGAHDLNLIGPIMSNNLEVIRRVRNVFAHSLADVSFSDAAIANACQRISLTDNDQFFVDCEIVRKIRYRFGYACNEIYRSVLGRLAMYWITGRPPARGALSDLPWTR